jgi:hypothetical protein
MSSAAPAYHLSEPMKWYAGAALDIPYTGVNSDGAHSAAGATLSQSGSAENVVFMTKFSDTFAVTGMS